MIIYLNKESKNQRIKESKNQRNSILLLKDIFYFINTMNKNNKYQILRLLNEKNNDSDSESELDSNNNLDNISNNNLNNISNNNLNKIEIKDVIDLKGQHILLPSEWTLWEHAGQREKWKNDDWKIGSYHKVLTINSVSELWKMLNNFYRLDHRKYDFFLMKDDVLPIWEHIRNKNGSCCSIRTEIINGINAINLLILHIVTNKLYTDDYDNINGISCSLRDSWMVIKIWCGFKEDKITSIIKTGVLGKLSNLTFKHIPTTPQY